MAETQNMGIFTSILSYCVFILLSPIATFFAFKWFIFQGLFGVDSTGSNVWSAVFAVIMLHIALGLYIYKAYYEAGKVKYEKLDEKVD